MELSDFFIPYDEALSLKELGFKERCLAVYLDNDKNNLMGLGGLQIIDFTYSLSAPLYEQALDWFEEKYNMLSVIDVIFYGENDDKIVFYYYIQDVSTGQKLFFPTKEYSDIILKATPKDSNIINYAQYEKYLLEASFTYFTKKEAKLACLRHLIGITKKQHDE